MNDLIRTDVVCQSREIIESRPFSGRVVTFQRGVVKPETVRVKLKRTFNQQVPDQAPIKFWRVVGPESHRNYQSDLSLEGLRTWGIL